MTAPIPPAPEKYQLRDQDQIRKILEQGLTDTVTRLISLETAPAVVPPPPPPPDGDLSNALRFGHANYGPFIGTGPGKSTSEPLYRFVQLNSATNTQLNNWIPIADEHDIWFLFAPSGGRGGFLDASGKFSRTLYEEKVRRYESNDILRDALDRKRVFMWAIDEAQHPSYHGSCNPDDVNWMGNLHKAIWGTKTPIFVRMGTNTMLTGWNNKPIPTNGWTGIDYGWEQRANQHNKESFEEFYFGRKQQLEGVDLGMVPGLNWWAGGVREGEINDGIGPCWDYKFNGTSHGMIVGANNTGTDHADFDQIPCGTFGDATKAVTSPDLWRKMAEVIVQDADFPFAMSWQWPENGSLGPASTAVANSLAFRQDYIDAFTDVLNTLNARPHWNGWRSIKSGDPI